jgi:hypothetical protein
VNSPVASMLPSQHVVDVENIVPILVVGSLVVHRLAGLCQDSSRVVRSLVTPIGAAEGIRRCQFGGEAFQRLQRLTMTETTDTQRLDSRLGNSRAFWDQLACRSDVRWLWA